MLEITNLYKTYNKGQINENKIFEDFSLKVAEGEFVTIVGGNGSGKSSILNIICGTISFDSGKIMLGGKDISSLTEFRRADYLGRVFQDPTKGTCPSMTILENMSMADCKGKGFGLSFCLQDKRVELYRELLKTLRLGLEDKLHVKVGSLSGGQRQALSLLISTTTKLSVLILDEHTAALDPKTSEIIMELTNKIIVENKMTAIMVTHNLKHASNFGGRLLMMDKGRIIHDKTGNDKKNLDPKTVLELFSR